MHEKRKSVRHDVDLSATIVIRGEAHPSRIENLSLGGVQMTLSERVPVGESVQVTFTIPTMDKPIEVDGLVRWSSDTAVGVQFGGLRAREVWSLNKYFESLEG